MTSINSNSNSNNSNSNNSNSNSNNNDDTNNKDIVMTTTTTTRSVKIHFKGAVSQHINPPSPATLIGLQAAVASAFGLELPEQKEQENPPSGMSFTYRDSDGDDIVFDKDSELDLALRLCPNSLEIAADMKVPTKPDDDIDRIYKVAARNLREYHGVPSMTPVKLNKTLSLLQLRPRCLVKQGLAPKRLLTGGKGGVPLGGGDNDDLVEMVTESMELTAVEDDKKEWNDGFVSVGDESSDDTSASAGEEPSTAAEQASSSSSSSSASGTPPSAKETTITEDNSNIQAVDAKPKNVIHSALLTADIKVRPREVMPLLIALGVAPRRFVKLGLVDGSELRAMLMTQKRCGGPDPQGSQRSRGCGPAGPATCAVGACGRCGEGNPFRKGMRREGGPYAGAAMDSAHFDGAASHHHHHHHGDFYYHGGSHRGPHGGLHEGPHGHPQEGPHGHPHTGPHGHPQEGPHGHPHKGPHGHPHGHPHRHPHGHPHEGPHGYPQEGPHGHPHKGPHGHPHRHPHGHPHEGPHGHPQEGPHGHPHKGPHGPHRHPHEGPYGPHGHPHEGPYGNPHRGRRMMRGGCGGGCDGGYCGGCGCGCGPPWAMGQQPHSHFMGFGGPPSGGRRGGGCGPGLCGGSGRACGRDHHLQQQQQDIHFG